MIPLFKVYMSPQAGDCLNKTLYSGFIGEGPVVKSFERVLKTYFRTPRVLAVNSASSGLEMAANLACRNERGYRFLTTPLTCTATNWPIVHNNRWINWVDIDPVTLNMDLNDLRRKLQGSVEGVMIMHWGGRAHDMDKLAKIQAEFEQEHNRPLPIIEDCAHAFGGFYKDRPLGTFGKYGVYSFQAIKPLTTGDGGCLIVRDQRDYDRAKLMRWYGIDRENRDADITDPGFKYHMNDLAATLGMANILGAMENVQKQMENARWMYIRLLGTGGVKLLARPTSDIRHPWWLFTILVERRDDFMRAMKNRGIETSLAHKRNDLYQCVEGYRTQLPGLESVDQKYVNIPVGWWLTEEERDYIVNMIRMGW